MGIYKGSMSYEPLHHKYRPQTFAELVGQGAIATTLSHALQQQRIAPAYLFTGPRGTGKTSSARILAKSLNCINSDVPTAKPCGVCEVCRAIARGSALDIIEIDAASNTGVDNIRELIERAQFAPVQCRYKVYVIDECLTGDSLVLTDEGLIRIDDPSIKGKRVLSYKDSSETWEFKRVTRWLDQGIKQTLIIKTSNNQEIQCTSNHLIRTEQGWIAAKDVKEGMRILSPVSADAAPLSTSSAQMDVSVDSQEDISLEAIPTDKSRTNCSLFLSKLNSYARSVFAVAEKNLKSLISFNKRVKGLEVFRPTGKNTPTNKNTGFGNLGLKSLLPVRKFCNLTYWDSFMEPCLETAQSVIQTSTADFLDYPGRMENVSENGWNTKLNASQFSTQNSESLQTRDTGNSQFVAAQSAILNLRTCLISSNLKVKKSAYHWIGLTKLLSKVWLGGIWMMAPSALAQRVALKFDFIQKAILPKKTKPLLNGLQQWVTQQNQDPTHARATAKCTTTFGWMQKLPGLGSQRFSNFQSHQWTTNLEKVESVRLAGVEKVYDLEVEDNHNFVANELLVHNCHMLSTAAFNALLKTLEEPPDRVVFVLATTDPQRVLPTIISRCQRFDFRRIPLEAMVEHLGVIASKEQINIAPDAIQLVAQISQGGLRDAESLLDQLSLLEGEITVERVWELVGAVPERDLLALVRAIAHDNAAALLDQARHLMDRGREPLIVLQNLASFYRDLLIAKTAPDRNDLVAITPPTWAELREFVQNLDLTIILVGQQHLRAAEVQVKNTTQPRLWLEVILMGLLPSAIASQTAPIEQRNLSIQPDSRGRSPSATPVIASPSPSAVPTPIKPNPTELEQAASQEVIPPQPEINEAMQRPPEVAASSEGEPSAEETAEPEAAQAGSQPAVDPSEQTNLNQLWQEVLNYLQPPSTRMLLRQQGSLTSFDGHVAQIAISAKWHPTVKERASRVEAAFQKACNHPVIVRIDAVGLPAQASNADLPKGISPAPQPTSQNSVHPIADDNQPPAFVPPPSSPASAKPSLAQDKFVGGNAHAQPSTNGHTQPPEQSPDLPLAKFSTDPSDVTFSASVWEAEDKVIEAAKSLATFFNGQVVSLEGDIELPQSSSIFSTDVGGSELSENETELDAEDDELPF
jgi:DNA polymerase-3 subunit gamma/tau